MDSEGTFSCPGVRINPFSNFPLNFAMLVEGLLGCTTNIELHAIFWKAKCIKQISFQSFKANNVYFVCAPVLNGVYV